MSFDTPTPPTPTSPQSVAQAQQGYNIGAGTASQNLNMVDQSNPYGSLNYTRIGTNPDGTPKYASSLNLTPQQQQLLDTLQGTQKTAGTAAGNILSSAGYGGPTNFADMSSGLTKDLLDKQISYLTPYYGQQTDQLDTKLRNQGINPDSPAYKQQMADLQNNQNRSVTGALVQLEPQAFNQTVQNYQLPVQMASQLAALGAPASAKNNLIATPSTNVGAADYTGANSSYNQYQNAAYQNQLAQNNALMQGVFGTAAAFI